MPGGRLRPGSRPATPTAMPSGIRRRGGRGPGRGGGFPPIAAASCRSPGDYAFLTLPAVRNRPLLRLYSQTKFTLRAFGSPFCPDIPLAAAVSSCALR